MNKQKRQKEITCNKCKKSKIIHYLKGAKLYKCDCGELLKIK